MDETMGNQQERLSFDMAWLAGIIEGEGWFSINKGGRNDKKMVLIPRIGMTNTDKLLIKETSDALKRLNIPHHIWESRNHGLGNKPKNDIVITGIKRVKTAISILLPYIRGSKKSRAELINEFLDSRLSLPQKSPYTYREIEIYELLKVRKLSNNR